MEKKEKEIKAKQAETCEEEQVVDTQQDEVAKLQNEIDDLKAQLEKSKNDYYKAYADTENLKKRLQNEAENTRKYRVQDFAKEILPAVDNLERALSQDADSQGYKKGVEMIYSQIIGALKSEGVEEIDALNKPFDANFHHAIMQEKVEGVEPNTVVEVLQKGYKLKDRILRAALVKVSE